MKPAITPWPATSNPDAPVVAELRDRRDDAGNAWGGTTFYDPDHYTRRQLCAISAAGCLAVAIAAIHAGTLPRAEQVIQHMSDADWTGCNEDPANPSALFADALEEAFRVLSDPDIWSRVIETAWQLDRNRWVMNEAAADPPCVRAVAAWIGSTFLSGGAGDTDGSLRTEVQRRGGRALAATGEFTD